MKKPFSYLAIFALISAPHVARADGNSLLEQCTTAIHLTDGDSTGQSSPTDGLNGGLCIGLMQGITITNKVYEVTKRTTTPLMCLPKDGITNGQAARIVIKYLNDHPEELHKEETFLATMALGEAFPCSKKKAR